ncbi:MAG: NapC/NirT family cytochrome c [Chitinivibrionia bacterium]|nr:NapC/NirT family cytochrome c [Chitinivibrionia bacterium]
MRWRFFLAMVLLGAGVLGGVAGGGAYYASRVSPDFCRSCHLMEASYQSWRTGEHRNLRCQDCHRPPFSQKVKGVWRWIRERPQTFPADVKFHFDQQFCVSCHKREDPDWSRRVLSFDHALHPLRDNARCLDCHRNGQHHYPAAKGEARCSRCHGPGASADLARCEGCHGASARSITAEVAFPVPRATSEHFGVPCTSCHLAGEGKDRPIHLFSVIREKEGEEGDFRGCRKCHQDYRPEEFQRFIRTPREEVRAALQRLREMQEGLPRPGNTSGSREVDGILKFIEEDGSSGFHNEVLTLFLLQRAEERLKEIHKEEIR